MTYNQTLVRKAASLVRRRGFWVLVSDSQSTESSYLYVGWPSRHGGFQTVAVLRVSYHNKPGYRRGGWLAYGDQTLQFDLRPRSRRYDMERVHKFLARIDGGKRS